MYVNNLINFKNFTILPEFFLSISILIILLYGLILSTKKKNLLIQNSTLNLGILVLFFLLLLLINENLSVIEKSSFNNTLINDSLSYFSKLIITFFSLFCIINIKRYLKEQKINNFEYILLYLFAVLGILLLCSSNDLITAYLSIELQSLSFYVMAAFKKNSNFSIDAGLKYFVLGSLSSGLFLFGSSLIYGFTGSTNFDDFKDLFFWFTYDNIFLLNDLDAYFSSCYSNDLYSAFMLRLNSNDMYSVSDVDARFFTEYNPNKIFSISLNDLVFAVESYKHFVLRNFQDVLLHDNIFDVMVLQFSLIFILISLFFKLAIAPFHVWLPDIYEGSPTSSTFFFAIIPKLSLFVILIRIFYYCFFGFIDYWLYIFIILALLSIIIGSFTAIDQRKVKSLFAFSSIGHMGYALIAYNSGSFEGIQMLLIYLVIYMLAGSFIWSVFLISKLKHKFTYKANKDLAEFSLLFKSNKILTFFLSIVLLSLAGFPPLIGFLAKTNIFLTAIKSYYYFVSLLAILCSVVSTFYYLRIIKILFFENKITGNLYAPINDQSTLSVVVIFYFFIFLFINPTTLYLITYKVCLLTSFF